MPRSRARRLNLNNDDLDLVENAKRAAARDDFAVYRRVIRREMLWDWWPQEVSEKLQQFYTRPESRATAQGGDHGPAGVGAPAGNVQPRAAEYLDVGVAAHDTLDFSIGALAQLVAERGKDGFQVRVPTGHPRDEIGGGGGLVVLRNVRESSENNQP
jgi:hypothetical protein